MINPYLRIMPHTYIMEGEEKKKIPLPATNCFPTKGDLLTIGGITYEVLHVLWDYDAQEVTIVTEQVIPKMVEEETDGH